MGKTITTIGLERGDTAYYLAKIITETGKTVLFIDNSRRGDIYHALPHIKNVSTKITYKGNLAYARNIYPTNISDEFDYCIIHQGNNCINEILYISDNIIISTDFVPTKMEEIITNIKSSLSHIENQEALDAKTKNVSILFRDIVSDKFSANSYMEILKKSGISNIESSTICNIYLERSDKEGYIKLCNHGAYKIKYYSDAFVDALCEVATIIMNEKITKKFIKSIS